jgi:hypothetical protein
MRVCMSVVRARAAIALAVASIAFPNNRAGRSCGSVDYTFVDPTTFLFDLSQVTASA